MTVSSVLSDPISTTAHPNRTNATAFQDSVVTDTIARGGLIYQYVGWYDTQPSNSKVTIAYRTRPEAEPGNWSAWTKATATVNNSGAAADAHLSITLGVDLSGRLHVFWSAHSIGNPVKYWRGTGPGDIEITSDDAHYPLVAGETYEADVSYPRLVSYPDGELYFSFRQGPAGGDARQIDLHWDDTSATWELASVYADWPGSTGDQESPYDHEPYIDHRGWWWRAWIWARQGSFNTYHDLHCIRSRDRGATWETASGDPISGVPGPGGGTLALMIAENSGMPVRHGMVVLSDGTVGIAYYARSDASAADTSVYLAVLRPGETAFARRTIFTVEGWSLVDSPDTPAPTLEISQIKFVHKPPFSTYMIYRTSFEGFDYRIVVRSCHELSLTELSDPELVTDVNFGEGAPVIDDRAWQAFGELYLYLQERIELTTSPTTNWILQVTELPEGPMGAPTEYAKNQMQRKRLGLTADAAPASWWIRLFLAGVELSGNGYAATAITNNTTNFPGAATRATSLAVSHSVGPADGGDLVFDEVRLYDAETGGNAWWTHTLAGPVTLLDSEGQSATFDGTGGSQITITAPAGAWPDDEAHAVLDFYFGAVAYTVATGVEFAYFAGDPQGAGAEITGTGYARHEYLNDDTENSAPANGVSKLINEVDLGTAAAADWDGATHAAKFDQVGTRLLESCQLPEARAVPNGHNETIKGARVRSIASGA